MTILNPEAPVEQMARGFYIGDEHLESIQNEVSAIRQKLTNWGVDDLNSVITHLQNARNSYMMTGRKLAFDATEAAQAYREHQNVGDESTVYSL